MLHFSRVNSVSVRIPVSVLSVFTLLYCIKIHITVFSELLMCVNFHETFPCYLPDMDVEYFGQGEAKVWYSAFKIFYSTGWLFSGMGWSNLCFKSLQTVVCSLWVHPPPLSGFSHILIPYPSSHLSFISTCLAAFQLEIQPYRGLPPKPKPRHKSYKRYAVSPRFAAITLFSMLKYSILFLPGSRTRWRCFGNWGHPTLLFKHCFVSLLLPCHKHWASRMEKHRAVGQSMGWGPCPLIASAPVSFSPLTEKCSSSSS